MRSAPVTPVVAVATVVPPHVSFLYVYLLTVDYQKISTIKNFLVFGFDFIDKILNFAEYFDYNTVWCIVI